MYKFSRNELEQAQESLKGKVKFKVDDRNYEEYERYILDSYTGGDAMQIKEEQVFNIGDEVVITNGEKRYILYVEWVVENAPGYVDEFVDRMSLSEGDTGTIKAKGKYCSQDAVLYLISNGDRVALISAEGIEYVTEDTIGRKFSLCQMLEVLEDNPEKKFILKGSNPVVVGLDDEGYLISSNSSQPISIYSAWNEYKEPVSFMEAFNAFREDRKDIYCMFGGEVYEFSSSSIEEYSFNEELIDYGEWYIV